MWTLRQEQIEAFAAVRRRAFAERVLPLLRKHWPEECAALGEAAARERIESAVVRARRYGVVKEYDVLRFVNMTFALHEDFDTDERYPWAAAFLNDPGIPGTRKMDRLCELTLEALRAQGASAEGGAGGG